jgi:ribosome-associated translation inhibitor RaiA
MQTPVEITFRGMSTSPSVEAVLQRWVTRLERSYPRLQHCAVVVEMPHQHGQQGNLFHIGIGLTVPGRTIAVSHELGHEDVYVAIADAFRAARRQLQDHARILRGDIKMHVA